MRAGFIAAMMAAALAATAQTQGYDAALRAFDAYEFNQAQELLDAYAAKRKRDQIAADRVENPYKPGEFIDRVQLLQQRIDLGRNMLERVEKIVVVDSFTVDRSDFFRAYRLDPTTGRLADTDMVEAIAPDAVSPVFSTEGGELMLWANSDDVTGEFSIMESSLLADGSREEPAALFTRAAVFDDNIDGQVCSPFLMADGVTLYFAADGPQSLGGLDIFLTRRGADGAFLQPSNIGMPYNSPANDFMMAIDEVTGAGWWATDRDTDEEHVKIFVFKPSELRVNFEPETADLAEYAMLRQFIPAETRERSEVLAAINSSARTAPRHGGEFHFAMPDGRIMTHLTDFRSPDARGLIGRWQALSQEIAENKALISRLRAERAQASQLEALEAEIESRRERLKQIANEIVINETR